MLKRIASRGILFLAAALVILTLGAPNLRGQLGDECCKKSYATQCVPCHVPPCDDLVCWRICTPAAKGVPGYRLEYLCCGTVPFNIWRLDDSNTCWKTVAAEVPAAARKHIRPFYVLACDGDYVLIGPTRKA